MVNRKVNDDSICPNKLHLANCSKNIGDTSQYGAFRLLANSGCGTKFNSTGTKASVFRTKLLNELAASEKFLQKKTTPYENFTNDLRGAVQRHLLKGPWPDQITRLPVNCNTSFKSGCVRFSFEYICFSFLLSLQYWLFHAWLIKSIKFINILNKVWIKTNVAFLFLSWGWITTFFGLVSS